MTTRKEIIEEVVAEAVKGFREELISAEKDREDEKRGGIDADIEKKKYKLFLDTYGKEAHYALYQEPYVITVGLTRQGGKDVEIRNERTGLCLASAGTESVAIQRFNKIAQERRVGRTPEMAGGKAVKVYLDAESIATASQLGAGNVSEGIRKALKIAAGTKP